MQKTVEADVLQALNEDIGSGDITGQLIPSSVLGVAKLHARQAAVVCGRPWVNEVLRQVSPALEITWQVEEGSYQQKPCVWAELKGPLTAMLTAERSALNFLQTLSAVATKTRHYVQCLNGTATKLLDTRKTLPGLRMAQKYAVRCGGGFNHRIGLYDEYLIKENHIAALGSLETAIEAALKHSIKKPIVVEVQNIEQFKIAQGFDVTRIMLDNFTDEMVVQALALNQKRHCPLEVSGNINEERLKKLAQMGIDYVSVGDLTKSISAIDLSLLVVSYDT